MKSLLPRILRTFAFVLAVATVFSTFAPVSLAAEGVSSKSKTVASSDGIPIAYEVHGTGPIAVVLVHGWSCDRSYWQAQLKPLSTRFKVVNVDLAGHGESGLGRKAWTMASFGGDVAAVVKKLGLERVVLVGHSMGGDVIVEAARQLQGRTAGLIWVDTYRELGPPRTAEQRAAFVARFRGNFVDTTRGFVRGMFPPNADKALVERVALDMSSAPQDVALGAMESAFSYDAKVPVLLQELKLPVIAINPDNSPSDSASLARHGVQLVVLSGVGHFLMMEDPQRFNPLLITAIEQLTR
jgi:pimeloyl-ACP methyl ester carboxylesterase